MKRLTLFIALALGATVGTARAQTAHPPHAAPGAPAPLRFTYTAGRHAVYTTRSVQSAPAAGGPTTITGRVEMDVVSVQPDGSAQMRLRVGSLDLQGAAVTPAIQHQISQGLAGMTLSYAQDARGQIGTREMPSGAPPEMRPLLEGLLQSLDQMSPQLPETPVAVGGTWNNRRTTHIPAAPGVQIDVTVDTTYTLRELRVSHATRVAVLALAMTMSIGNVTVSGSTVSGAGNATGEATLDLGQGLLTDSHSTGTMTLHVASQGRTADMPISSTNEMRLATTP